MKLAAWIIAIALALYALHRLALWMEWRGWIYYRKHKRGSAAMGSVMLEIQSFYRPSVEHVIEQRQEEQREEDDSGDRPKPGREFTAESAKSAKNEQPD